MASRDGIRATARHSGHKGGGAATCRPSGQAASQWAHRKNPRAEARFIRRHWPRPFRRCIAFHLDKMSPAEQRVARVLLEAREEVLVASAASLAAKAETSDATVVRTVADIRWSGVVLFGDLVLILVESATRRARR